MLLEPASKPSFSAAARWTRRRAGEARLAAGESIRSRPYAMEGDCGVCLKELLEDPMTAETFYNLGCVFLFLLL